MSHDNTKFLLERIEKLEAQEAHINKLHEMINMENRITASDVLNRLTLLEKEQSDLEPWTRKNEVKFYSRLKSLEERIDRIDKNHVDIHFLLEHVNSIHKRIDAQAEYFDISFKDILNQIAEINKFHDVTLAQYRVGHIKKPHKCPVCDGIGKVIIGDFRGLPIKTDKCHSCEGKGLVWG